MLFLCLTDRVFVCLGSFKLLDDFRLSSSFIFKLLGFVDVSQSKQRVVTDILLLLVTIGDIDKDKGAAKKFVMSLVADEEALSVDLDDVAKFQLAKRG